MATTAGGGNEERARRAEDKLLAVVKLGGRLCARSSDRARAPAASVASRAFSARQKGLGGGSPCLLFCLSAPNQVDGLGIDPTRAKRTSYSSMAPATDSFLRELMTGTWTIVFNWLGG